MISQPSTKVAFDGRVEYYVADLSQCEQLMRVLELTVQLLIMRTSLGDHWAEGLREAANLLAAMPLPTEEFVSANKHLQNARSYSQQREFGAAAFELRALRGQLQRL
jgi:hypothetical protein